MPPVGELPTETYDRILLATDGTVASENAERQAISLAKTHGAPVRALYVVDEDVYGTYSGDEYVDEAEGPEHGLEEYGREHLASVRERAAAEDVSVVEVLERGDPAETVVDYAEDEDVDLIVLGTKRRSAEYRNLLGSVTDRVVRLTRRAAVVVKTEVEESGP